MYVGVQEGLHVVCLSAMQMCLCVHMWQCLMIMIEVICVRGCSHMGLSVSACDCSVPCNQLPLLLPLSLPFPASAVYVQGSF